MRNNTILRLQEEYLENPNPDIITELYNNLIRLGFYVLKYGNHYKMSYDEKAIVVYDVVSSIIVRLMAQECVIIKKNPLAYLQRSILYASKPIKNNKNKVVYIEDYEGILYADSERDPVCCEIITKEFIEGIEIFLDEWLDGVEKDCDKEILRNAFYDCLQLEKPYQKYLYKLRTSYLKNQFKELMCDFQCYIHSFV